MKNKMQMLINIIAQPNILLLDEPLGALDLKLRKEMQLELKRLQREMNITFVYVTHDQEEALTMSDTVVVMDKGRIIEQGSHEELMKKGGYYAETFHSQYGEIPKELLPENSAMKGGC
mgnify:CR=1 FL=1